MSSEELKETQNIMEEKVYRIWTVLSAFEGNKIDFIFQGIFTNHEYKLESAAGCISDMLLHVSEGSYTDGVKMADYFVTHVDVLFTAIDDLADQYFKQTKEELYYERESSMLCKKVSNFFSLFSHTQESGLRKIGITQDLLSLVTGLAHYLKVLIRIGLTGALSLERKTDTKSGAISRFLSQLMELANKKRQYLHEADYTVSSDLCQFCRKACEDACYRYQACLWHDQCFACSQCCVPLRDEYSETFIHNQTLTIVCKKCITQKECYSQGVQYISKLKQSSFLLRVALRRLYSLLNVPGNVCIYMFKNINVLTAMFFFYNRSNGSILWSTQRTIIAATTAITNPTAATATTVTNSTAATATATATATTTAATNSYTAFTSNSSSSTKR
jgi:hypothetical protein